MGRYEFGKGWDDAHVVFDDGVGRPTTLCGTISGNLLSRQFLIGRSWQAVVQLCSSDRWPDDVCPVCTAQVPSGAPGPWHEPYGG